MEALNWLWWTLVWIAQLVWSVLWFLIGGWVSTLAQIAILISIIYVVKYGWQRAPAEIWRHTSKFGRFFWDWLRAREPGESGQPLERETIKVIRAHDFGDINVSTLLTLMMLAGLIALRGL